jgi:hypothetical protein
VLNVPLMKSIDGGETFSKIRDAARRSPRSLDQSPGQPHHDQRQRRRRHGDARWRQDLVEHPQPAHGAVLPPLTDRQTPWRLYGGQQDNSTVSIAAWAWDGAIGRDDYHAVGGGESAHIAFDPDNPDAHLRHDHQRHADGVRRAHARSEALHRALPGAGLRRGCEGPEVPQQLELAGDHLAPRSLGDLLRHPVPAEEHRPRHDLGRGEPGPDAQQPRAHGPQRRAR